MELRERAKLNFVLILLIQGIADAQYGEVPADDSEQPCFAYSLGNFL